MTNRPDEHIDFESDPSDLSHAELRGVWEDVYEVIIDGRPTDDLRRRCQERRREVWQEMQSRVDAEPPECPECGAQNWSQEFGGPKSCQCGYHPGADEMDLIEDIDDYWSAVKSGQEVA